jgi:hypothetical protein
MAEKAERKKHRERVQRCITEGLRLLEIDDTKTQIKVMGSTGTEYQVSLNDLNITCNCQDCIRRHRKCKHILFVLSRVLRLSESELEQMGPRSVLAPSIRDNLIFRAKEFVERRAVRPISREADDACGICLEPFKAVVACVRDCEQCWHSAHADCLKEWHTASRRPVRSCPFCRADDKMGDAHILRVLKAWNAEKVHEDAVGKLKTAVHDPAPLRLQPISPETEITDCVIMG